MTLHDTFAGSTVRHGTNSGWRQHQLLGEPTCDACRAAKSEYDKRRLKTPVLKQRNRLRATAQGRANQELVSKYRAEYRRLFDRHLQEVFDEAAREYGPEIYPATWGPDHCNPRSEA